MKRLLVLLLLVSLTGAASARGSGEAADASAGPHYPESVDPLGRYEAPVRLSIGIMTNAATTFPAGDSYADNIWTRALLEELNIEIDIAWEAVGGDRYDTKLNLAIASNDLPDAVKLTNAGQFSRLVNAGRLADLTEAFDRFAYPQLGEWFEEDGGLRRSYGTVGDRLYGISPSTANYQTARMIFIRKDWREDLGFGVPSSMDDVIAMARAFKAIDPQSRYGILITSEILDNGMSDMFAIANSMGVWPRRWLEEDGELVYGSIQPGMKDVLTLYKQLYDEGLINPEFATTDGGASAPQLTNSMVGIAPNAFWLYSWPLNSLYASEGVEWETFPVMPMRGYEGGLRVSMDRSNREFFVVRSGYRNPEALIKVLNFQALKINDPVYAEQRFHSDGTYSNHMMMPFYPAFGPLRVNFDTYVNVTKAIQTNSEAPLVTPHDHLQYGRIQEYFAAKQAGEKPDQGAWVSKNFFYGERSAFGVLDHYWRNDMFLLSPADGIRTNEMIRRGETLDQLEAQYYVEIITGRRPLSDFDTFVQDWRDLGGALIEFEINEWYKSIQ